MGMAYTVQPENGEELAAEIELNLSKKAQPFHFAVSNRAIYIPRIKFIAGISGRLLCQIWRDVPDR